MNNILDTLKKKGVFYTIVGLSQKIDKLKEEVLQLQQDNQDLRNIIARFNNGDLEERAYIQLEKMLIDNREVIKPQSEDIWNIHRRIDQLQKQLIENGKRGGYNE